MFTLPGFNELLDYEMTQSESSKPKTRIIKMFLNETRLFYLDQADRIESLSTDITFAERKI